MTSPTYDPGPVFEQRALALARAIHDPLGIQGSMMLLGKERDGVFINDDSIHVYEFTTLRTKEKANKDAKKLIEAINHLKSEKQNRFKTGTGWFVTQEEPTADQRQVVANISQAGGIQINCLSAQTLRGRICDIEGYLAHRQDAPFGSTSYAAASSGTTVQPRVVSPDGTTSRTRDIADLLTDGSRVVLTGDFGSGKSFSLKMIYDHVRRTYFKKPAENPFPIHINLRDCTGLRSPAEILRRHAEDIGFSGERGLMSAWRSGTCVMILDGFDEVIPSRWLGTARGLRDVRWEALAPVRRLIEEAHPDMGIIVAGRGHYFSSSDEMLRTLGLPSIRVLTLEDFTEDQAAEFISKVGQQSGLPPWLPTRPLLLSYLLSKDVLPLVSGLDTAIDRGIGWRLLLDMLCDREAKMYQSVSPETIRQVLRRLAVRARSKGDESASLTTDDLSQVYYEVSGSSTDEESLQALLRLPGLATQISNEGESRVFADEEIASVVYGETLGEYIASPYQGHALTQPAEWAGAAGPLAIEVCSAYLAEIGVTPPQVIAAADFRMSRGNTDCILLDMIATADEMDAESKKGSYVVDGIYCQEITPTTPASLLARTHFRDCLIDLVDLTSSSGLESMPTIQDCIIERVTGSQAQQEAFKTRVIDSEVAEYESSSETTSSLLDLNLDADDRVALTILHKVYTKRGSGRKQSALPRGLDPSIRDRVQPVVADLVSKGYLHAGSRGTNTIYLPARGKAVAVAKLLSDPQNFTLSELQ